MVPPPDGTAGTAEIPPPRPRPRIDPKAYETTLRNVAEDADKLREYLKK